MHMHGLTKSVAAVAACGALAAGGACRSSSAGAGNTGGTVMGNYMPTSATDANILALLHESNLGEIQAANVAKERAKNEEVRSFAQRMIDEHSTLDQQGSALAQQLGVTPELPNKALQETQSLEMQTIGPMSGGIFDRTYMRQQVNAHERTLNIVDASIEKTQNADLRSALQTQVRPRVADHLRMAQELRDRVRE